MRTLEREKRGRLKEERLAEIKGRGVAKKDEEKQASGWKKDTILHLRGHLKKKDAYLEGREGTEKRKH